MVDHRSAPVLVEHFFRREYGRTVAALVRTFGPRRLELVEDSVQSALALALTSWSLRGVPTTPAAWLMRVARNQVIDALRRGDVAERSSQKVPERAPAEGELGLFADEIDDAEMRMLFVCCDDGLPLRTQLVLALKVLCGFTVAEIALRLMSGEEATRKRIARGREQLRRISPGLESPPIKQLRQRLPAVHRVIYLLFNEGYSSARAEQPIRRELCEEALRLGHQLVAHPAGDAPDSWALLALMRLHHARIDGRTGADGGLLLLEEQDRGLWHRQEICQGLEYLAQSASGGKFSRYHAEAGVLAEHCSARSYAETNWPEVVDLYQTLERLTPSPLHTLNRAIAVAEWKGAQAGLEILEAMTPPAWLGRYYLWDATMGELNRRIGRYERARHHLQRAQAAAPTESEQSRLRGRLEACTAKPTNV